MVPKRDRLYVREDVFVHCVRCTRMYDAIGNFSRTDRVWAAAAPGRLKSAGNIILWTRVTRVGRALN